MNVLEYTFQGLERDGRVSHPLYNTHQMMVRRCYDPQMSSFVWYGENGITVTEKWLGPQGFWKFAEDMGERPEGMTLDRIDPFGDYSKENCRWADSRTQANNTRLQNKNNSSGAVGVHWCKRDNCWIAQISLNKRRTCIGRYSFDDFDMAQSVYLEAKSRKISGISDDDIIKEFITQLRVGSKKAKLKRNKTSKYWGVSYKKSTDSWIASTTEYIGVSKTEEGANDLVQQWLQRQEQLVGLLD